MTETQVSKLSAWGGHSAVAVPYGTNATAYSRGVTFKEACVFGPGSIEQANQRKETSRSAAPRAGTRLLTREHSCGPEEPPKHI